MRSIASGMSHKETLMNETIAFRPKLPGIDKDGCQLYAGITGRAEQLHPALNLLAHPSIVRGSHDFFCRCYDAGVQACRQVGAVEMVAVLPDSLPQERQRSGLLCRVAGRLMPCATLTQSFM